MKDIMAALIIGSPIIIFIIAAIRENITSRGPRTKY